VTTVQPRFVYAFHSAALCALKFGRTYCWEVRLAQLRYLHAPDLTFITMVERSPWQAMEIEYEIHERLRGRAIHVPGLWAKSKEWYSDSDPKALTVLAHLLRDAVAPVGVFEVACLEAKPWWKPDFSTQQMRMPDPPTRALVVTSWLSPIADAA
jgi:hypothetical protein